MKRIAPLILAGATFAMVALSLAPLTGCKGQLEPGGAYAPAVTNGTNVVATSAPMMDLYITDSAFNAAYDTVDLALSVERNNRALIKANWPEVKSTLDGIRPQIVAGIQDYGRFKKAYLANPTPANLDKLSNSLSKFRQLASSITAAIPPELLQKVTGSQPTK
jgi:ABC-type uncharacterized transport system auxiliary subunit